METKIQQFPSFYETVEIEEKRDNNLKNFFIAIAKSTGIFFFMSFIVFFIVNYQFVKSQIVDWQGGGGADYSEIYLQDTDEDGLPDWWEREYQLNVGADDSREDNDDDYANNLVEYLFGTDPTDSDSDDDSYSDGEEIRRGYNPKGEGRSDVDGDQIFDWWEEKFGFSDDDRGDADLDLDGDGLSNLEEFLFQTDPRNTDSDRDGIADKREIETTSNPMDIDIPKAKGSVLDKDGDGLILFYEELYGTDPDSVDSDSDGFDDFRELSRGYDPTGEGMIKGRIAIPRIGVAEPIVWIQDAGNEEVENNSAKGAVHYPTTAFPGMRGNVGIVGSDSYYTWDGGQFEEVFEGLDELQAGDEVIISLELVNDKKVEIIYSVRFSILAKTDDYRLFQDFEGYEMTLVTCWPPGTDRERWMVKADLESPKP